MCCKFFLFFVSADRLVCSGDIRRHLHVAGRRVDVLLCIAYVVLLMSRNCASDVNSSARDSSASQTEGVVYVADQGGAPRCVFPMDHGD